MNKLGQIKRKAGFALALSLVVCQGASLGSLTAFATETGTVTCNVLNVRSGGSTDDSVITTISKGTTVEIVSTSGEWHQVKVNGVSGYVHSQYITKGSGSSTDSSSTGSGASSGAVGQTGTVNVSALNFRSGASTSSSQISLLSRGQTVSITGTEGSWYKVDVNGKSGYVFAEYITVGGSGSTGTDTSSGTENPTGTPVSGTGTVNVSALNVRKSASTSSGVIGLISRGDSVELIEKTGDWYKATVKVNGSTTTGYVFASYITLGSSGTTDTGSSNGNSGDSSVTTTKDTVYATATVNIRSGAGTSHSIYGTLKKGASIERTGTTSDGWSQVNYNGKTAYISSTYLSTTNPNSGSATGEKPSSVTGQQVVDYAVQFVGNPYVYGGNSLTNGVDCSGFTQQVYKHFGINLARVADAQKNNGTRVSYSEAQPGDLVFFGSSSYASHVGIYMGNGQMVHASTSRTGIIIGSVYETPVAVVRLVN